MPAWDCQHTVEQVWILLRALLQQQINLAELIYLNAGGRSGYAAVNCPDLEQASMYTLVIANRNYSSWSLPAWLYLTESNIHIKEIWIPLFTGQPPHPGVIL